MKGGDKSINVFFSFYPMSYFLVLLDNCINIFEQQSSSVGDIVRSEGAKQPPIKEQVCWEQDNKSFRRKSILLSY